MNSLHFHRHSHPGRNAALEVMGALRKPGDLHLAALEYPRSGNLNVLEPAFTLIDRRFSAIQSVDKTAAKFFDFCEGVRLSALVGHYQRCSFHYLERVRFKVPPGIRGACRRFGKKVLEGGCRSQCDIFAEVCPQHGVEACRITLVQRYEGRNAEWMLFCQIAVCAVVFREESCQTDKKQATT